MCSASWSCDLLCAQLASHVTCDLLCGQLASHVTSCDLLCGQLASHVTSCDLLCAQLASHVTSCDLLCAQLAGHVMFLPYTQDWKLYVPLDEYYAFVTGMEGRVALRQASKRGWLTYTDLMAVWDATEIENSMLAASQQTAKVRAHKNSNIQPHKKGGSCNNRFGLRNIMPRCVGDVRS